MTAPPSLPGWLLDDGLQSVWSQLRQPLESRGGAATGSVRLRGLPREARHALSGLLGRPLVRADVTLDLAQLADLLSTRVGIDLATLLEATTGGPLRNRPAERVAAARRRTEPMTLLESLVAGSPVLAGAAWVPRWCDDLRRFGVLARDTGWEAVVHQAVAVLDAILDAAAGSHGRPRRRADLAVACAQDAHALDEGRTLPVVVLRALSAVAGLPVLPADARGRRELWERFGVVPDLVSSTVLTLGLRPAVHGPREEWLRDAADRGDPVHVTARDLRRVDVHVPAGQRVLVCENPRVLEAFADMFGAGVTVVCTSGWPAVVGVELLERLRDGGAVLRYHGDFDWPGIDIANRLIAAVGVEPWLMSAAHYEQAVPEGGGLVLSGRATEPAWDAELGAVMRHHGIAVHEEAVLADLLYAARQHWQATSQMTAVSATNSTATG
jgi:uncharacterized protein (TIGR02679 family)